MTRPENEQRPGTGQPETGQPETGRPETGQPETGRPETGRPDPADTAPAEGQSRSTPSADQGKDQGADLAYDAPPSEGARDED